MALGNKGVLGQSARLVCGYVYADAGEGESTTDLVFTGHNLIAAGLWPSRLVRWPQRVRKYSAPRPEANQRPS